MDLAGLLADGARWALVTVFALAAAEKAQTLFHRSAAWHPVILARARWRRQAAARTRRHVGRIGPWKHLSSIHSDAELFGLGRRWRPEAGVA